MNIGLIDVDGHNFPNVALMKISAWHKQNGDNVEMVIPIERKHYDKVYMSKVFSFSPDYPYYIDANEVQKGGSGYAISLENGREVFNAEADTVLPDEIEHMFPDYSLYNITDRAFGYLTRGCPRGCSFCHVAAKEGRRSRKVADLSEFWNGQKRIILLDPNMFACREWEDLADQLIASKASVDFSQGVDIRIMNEEHFKKIKRMKIDLIHFAWDRYEDKDVILPKLKAFKEITGFRRRKTTVYTLANYDTTFEQDLERVMTLREMDYDPYIMIYDKEHVKPGANIKKLARWVNAKYIWAKCPTFEDYIRVRGSEA